MIAPTSQNTFILQSVHTFPSPHGPTAEGDGNEQRGGVQSPEHQELPLHQEQVRLIKNANERSAELKLYG